MDFMLGWTMVYHHNVQKGRKCAALPAVQTPGAWLRATRRRLSRKWRPQAWRSIREAAASDLSPDRAPHCR